MANEEGAEAEPKKGFDLKIIVAGVLIFLLALGASYFIMKSLMSPLMPKQSKNTTQAIAADQLVSVGDFTTNINDAAGTRYIKVEIYVQLSDTKVKDSVNTDMPIIKDSILTILSSQTVADLDVSNRDKLKQEMKKDINSKIGSNVISNVYFTDFIMQ